MTRERRTHWQVMGMSDTINTDDTLKQAHSQVTITVPRWTLDTTVAAAELVAGNDDCPDDLRRDLEAAASTIRSRYDDPSEDGGGDE